ncbi:MAG TPA: S-layer homology domain-containing protein, partial [Euzebyales bacterium]|nr:S-layer homology domain-containing protein [Euzebyales bacterium]
ETFAPNRSLTRAQTAAILVRLAEHLEGSALPSGQRGRFSDISRSVHRDVILKAAAVGFTVGRGDGTFRPGAEVTRGQGATFVVRMLDRLVRNRHVDLPL